MKVSPRTLGNTMEWIALFESISCRSYILQSNFYLQCFRENIAHVNPSFFTSDTSTFVVLLELNEPY